MKKAQAVLVLVELRVSGDDRQKRKQTNDKQVLKIGEQGEGMSSFK